MNNNNLKKIIKYNKIILIKILSKLIYIYNKITDNYRRNMYEKLSFIRVPLESIIFIPISDF